MICVARRWGGTDLFESARGAAGAGTALGCLDPNMDLRESPEAGASGAAEAAAEEAEAAGADTTEVRWATS